LLLLVLLLPSTIIAFWVMRFQEPALALHYQLYGFILLLASIFALAISTLFPLGLTRQHDEVYGVRHDLNYLLRKGENQEAFFNYLRREFLVEGFLFWKALSLYGQPYKKKIFCSVLSEATELYDTYIKDTSERQVELPSQLRDNIRKELQRLQLQESPTTVPESLCHLFDVVQNEIYGRLCDAYTRFQTTQEYGALRKQRKRKRKGTAVQPYRLPLGIKNSWLSFPAVQAEMVNLTSKESDQSRDPLSSPLSPSEKLHFDPQPVSSGVYVVAEEQEEKGQERIDEQPGDQINVPLGMFASLS